MTKSGLFLLCHENISSFCSPLWEMPPGSRERWAPETVLPKRFWWVQSVAMYPNTTEFWFNVHNILDDGNTFLCCDSISSKSAGKSLSWWGDPLWRPDHPHIPQPLSSGAPRVPVGPKQMWLSPSRGRAPVRVDAPTAHKLRTHSQSHPDRGGQLLSALSSTWRWPAAPPRGALW